MNLADLQGPITPWNHFQSKCNLTVEGRVNEQKFTPNQSKGATWQDCKPPLSQKSSRNRGFFGQRLLWWLLKSTVYMVLLHSHIYPRNYEEFVPFLCGNHPMSQKLSE